MTAKHSWFAEYCEKTSAPCMRYLTMKQRSLLEKSVWFLIFVCMILITFESLRMLLNVWIHNPTVMTIDNAESAIRDIPFPLITVCPSSQIQKSAWTKYMGTNSSDWENINRYQNVFVCSTYTYFSGTEQQSLEEFIDYDLFKKVFHESGISCSKVFQSDFKWQNTTLKNVCQYIQPSISLLGVCYTINMMPSRQIFNEEYNQKYLDFFSNEMTYDNTANSNWNVEDGYPFDSNQRALVDVIPARTSGVSYYHSLRLILHSLHDDYLGCDILGVKGGSFVVTFSNPAEYRSVSPRLYYTPDTFAKVQITPSVKKINSDVKWRSLEVRRCYLHDERKLAIFRQYTELNCNHECEINTTTSMCGCVMVESAFLGTNGVQVCGPAKYTCAAEAIVSTKLPDNLSVCNCLPSCSTIEYDVTDASHFDDWKYMKILNEVQNNSRGVTIELAFKKPYFTAYASASILNLESLISNVGGILGLFLGLNLINIFEILFVLIKIVHKYIITLLFLTELNV